MRMMRRKPKKFVWVTALMMILAAILYADYQLKNSILQLSKSSVQLKGSEILNRIVNEEVVAQVKYEDIVAIHKDKEGKIVLIQPNTVVLNRVIANTIEAVSYSMRQMNEDSVSVPLGQLSGIRLLAGAGPEMTVRVVPSSEVHVDLQNKFEQAGINQTRHLIYLVIDSKMRIAVPYLSDEVDVISTIPLAETIIVGEVPSSYVNFKGNDQDLYRFSQGK